MGRAPVSQARERGSLSSIPGGLQWSQEGHPTANGSGSGSGLFCCLLGVFNIEQGGDFKFIAKTPGES